MWYLFEIVSHIIIFKIMKYSNRHTIQVVSNAYIKKSTTHNSSNFQILEITTVQLCLIGAKEEAEGQRQGGSRRRGERGGRKEEEANGMEGVRKEERKSKMAGQREILMRLIKQRLNYYKHSSLKAVSITEGRLKT